MNKSLLIVVGVIAAATVGYVVYMSYFTVKDTVVTDSEVPAGEVTAQPFVMPSTEEEKLEALNALAPSTNASASTISSSEKEKVLNSAAGSPKDSAAPAQNSEKIKLLESLKK